MVEEFSKLSIRNKSTTMSQSMHWIIPQSRLNHHCPFLEKEYPYFTTEFSILHPSSVLEMKWRLEMKRKNDKVSVNILNVNEKALFAKKELMNVQVRWNFRLKSGQDDGPMGILSEQMINQRENMEVYGFQFFKDSQSEGRVVCDLESFDSFAIDGRFVVEVKIELEYFQVDGKKMSFFDQTKRFSASLSELSESVYSKIEFHQKSLSIASDASGCSAPCQSWVPDPQQTFVSSTIDRSKPNSFPIPEHTHLPFPHQPITYQYHKPSSSLSGSHSLRRSRSGRFPSNLSTISGASSYSNSTLDQVSRARHLSGHLDESQASEDFDNYQTYSYIPSYLFSDPALPPSSTAVQYPQATDEVFQQPQGCIPIYPTPPLPTSEQVYNQPYQPSPIKKSSAEVSLDQISGFQAQFYSGTAYDTSLSESSLSSASSSMISCIYTGRLPDPSVILKDRRKLLEMGVKHSLVKLVKECEKSYLQTLQVKNCLETLLVVDNFLPSSELRKTVINFMKVNLKELMKEPNWDKFVENCEELVNEVWPVEDDVVQ